MKKIFMKISFVLLFAMCSNLMYASNVETWIKPGTQDINGFVITPELQKAVQTNMDLFLSLTPKKYTELTGKKLSFVQVVKLKAAQKYIKKHYAKKSGEGISKGVYILLAFLGLAWLAMGIKDDWSGNNWWVNLILTFLCWLPGFIHALVKMKEYY